MSANVMQFSLGLAAGGFLSTIGQAQRGVSGLIGAGMRLPVIGTAVASIAGSFLSLGAIAQNTFAVFEKGSELKGLSQRSGESVQSLVMLEAGFKAVLKTADGVPGALMQMQKSLGGFNEMGEPTKDVFAAIGLGVKELKEMDGPGALQSIAKALAKLPNDQAANFASKIFGRNAAGDILQIARSGDEFGNAMERSSAKAALFARNYLAFDRITKSVTELKNKANTIFLSLAEAAAPGVQALLNKLNTMDLTGAAVKIGNFVSAAGEAITNGGFGELIALSIGAGFEKGLNYAIYFVQGVGKLWGSVFDSPDFLLGAFEAFGSIAAMLTNAILRSLGPVLAHMKAMFTITGTFEEQYQKALKEFEEHRVQGAAESKQAFADSMEVLFANTPDVLQKWKQGLKEIGGVQDTVLGAELENKIAALNARAAKSAGGDLGAKNKNDGNLAGAMGGAGLNRASEANALEKIGLRFFGGGFSPDTQYHRATSQNTAALLEQVKQQTKILGRIPFGPNQIFNK